MGLLVRGEWFDKGYEDDKGEFKREDSWFRRWITADGSSGFKAESGRYHLFVSLACPWAHRTLIFRHLKNLSEHIGVTVVDTDMLEHGWEFKPLASHINSDDNPLGELQYLYEVYSQASGDYVGRVTVPVLWDKQRKTIVNNESSEIIRMFNSAFNDITGNTLDFYPETHRDRIDAINQTIYHSVNNGVYKVGFATTQAAYEKAFGQLFVTLDELDILLSRQRYLIGDYITEADWRLFTTLIRFDAVYYGHFKCNRQPLEAYLHLSEYLRDLYQQVGIANTVNFDHIKRHYYYSHIDINPAKIVPLGPFLDYGRPHQRASLGKAVNN